MHVHLCKQVGCQYFFVHMHVKITSILYLIAYPSSFRCNTGASFCTLNQHETCLMMVTQNCKQAALTNPSHTCSSIKVDTHRNHS